MAIRVYTTPSCSDCRRAKRILDQWRIEYEEVNIVENPQDAERVIELNHGRRRVPTFEFNGKSFACSPFDADVLREGLARILNA